MPGFCRKRSHSIDKESKKSNKNKESNKDRGMKEKPNETMRDIGVSFESKKDNPWTHIDSKGIIKTLQNMNNPKRRIYCGENAECILKLGLSPPHHRFYLDTEYTQRDLFIKIADEYRVAFEEGKAWCKMRQVRVMALAYDEEVGMYCVIGDISN